MRSSLKTALRRDELILALQARERFLDAILGSLEVFFTVDEDWRLTYVNRVAAAMAGASAEDLVGRDLWRVMSAEFHDVASVQLRRATEWVGLKIRPTRVTLSVRDDGRGFDPAPVGPAHLGLRVMRERAEEVGARLRLVSGPGEGTLIAVEWRGEPSRNEASAGDPPA